MVLLPTTRANLGPTARGARARRTHAGCVRSPSRPRARPSPGGPSARWTRRDGGPSGASSPRPRPPRRSARGDSQPSVDPPPARAGAAAPSPSSPSADHLSKTALGSCALLAMCAVVEPASARGRHGLPPRPPGLWRGLHLAARRARRPLQPGGAVHADGVPAARPEQPRSPRSRVSVSAYLVIPKASELLVKFVLAPAIVLVVAAAAAQHPAETSAVAAAAISRSSRQPDRHERRHPRAVRGVPVPVLPRRRVRGDHRVRGERPPGRAQARAPAAASRRDESDRPRCNAPPTRA